MTQAMNEGNGKSNDADPTEVGTVAGRAPAPVVPKPGADDASTGSPGAAADREQAKERAHGEDKA